MQIQCKVGESDYVHFKWILRFPWNSNVHSLNSCPTAQQFEMLMKFIIKFSFALFQARQIFKLLSIVRYVSVKSSSETSNLFNSVIWIDAASIQRIPAGQGSQGPGYSRLRLSAFLFRISPEFLTSHDKNKIKNKMPMRNRSIVKSIVNWKFPIGNPLHLQTISSLNIPMSERWFLGRP